MKRIYLLILASLIIFTSCTQNSIDGISEDKNINLPAETESESEAESTETDTFGLTLSVKDVTSTGLTLVFTQKGGNPKGTLEIGEQYSLDVWDGSLWESVPYKPSEYDIAWHAIAYIIAEGKDSEFSINWEYLYGELPAGNYRISKEVSDFVVANNYDKHTYYAEFEIGE